jgi:hypothetical protein
MFKLLLLAGAILASAALAGPEVLACQAKGCPTLVSFSSSSASRSYGLLIAAPDSGCRHVRFRVEGAGAAFLGHTPPLAPGELAVVRLGRGFPEGRNWLKVAAVGCKTHPATLRRVVLAQQGPDHSWRAALH